MSEEKYSHGNQHHLILLRHYQTHKKIDQGDSFDAKG